MNFSENARRTAAIDDADVKFAQSYIVMNINKDCTGWVVLKVEDKTVGVLIVDEVESIKTCSFKSQSLISDEFNIIISTWGNYPRSGDICYLRI